MTDRAHPNGDGPASEIDEAVPDPDDADSDRRQDVHLLATKPTRTRPNALDLERTHD
jgi:hypothetical protein